MTSGPAWSYKGERGSVDVTQIAIWRPPQAEESDILLRPIETVLAGP